LFDKNTASFDRISLYESNKAIILSDPVVMCKEMAGRNVFLGFFILKLGVYGKIFSNLVHIFGGRQFDEWNKMLHLYIV